MIRLWSKPLLGVQCMLGLPLGYAAVVDFGSVAEASVRSPSKPTISQLFDDANSARSWAEERAAIMCLTKLPIDAFAQALLPATTRQLVMTIQADMPCVAWLVPAFHRTQQGLLPVGDLGLNISSGVIASPTTPLRRPSAKT